MTTRIEINPNLRVGDHLTMADLDNDVYGPTPALFDLVEVFESASGMIGQGWVTAIDAADRIVTLLVEWASLQGGCPEFRGTSVAAQ